MTTNLKANAKLKKNLSKLLAFRVFDDRSLVFNYLPAFISVWILKHLLIQTEYKLKRESITYFQRANVAYGAHKQRRSARLSRVAFKLLGNEFPKSYARLIIGATNQTQRDASRRSALSSEILDATNLSKIETTDATGWYQLSRGLFSVGYFRAAWVARENSIELSIREGEVAGAGDTAVNRAIQAHLERRNFAEVEALLAKVAEQIKDSGMRDICDYLDMMQNKYVMPPLDSASPSFEAEKLFSELISDKSVALVGPGNPSGHYGNEIDSADTVVRVKYVGREHLPPQEIHGHRCDINYFGMGEISSLLSNLSAEEQMATYGDVKLTLSFGPHPTNNSRLTIFCMPLSGTTYRTTSHAGIRTLFTILRFGVSRIKKYGIDFYANDTEYSKQNIDFLDVKAGQLGHAPSIQASMKNFSSFYRSSGFSEHDPVSNFCFAQNLYKAGLFDIEPYGKSILELTPYQYVERLEEVLGDW